MNHRAGRCPDCKTDDPSKFAKNKSRWNGLQTYCRECHNKRQRPAYLQMNYGMTEEQYQNMLKEQGNVCALCGKPPAEGRYGKLYIDHDHETKEVRGLIHLGCNVLIGYAFEDPEVLQSAIEYLHKYKKTTTIAPSL